jgi:mRNA-degrading endonuclease toxin of MazEF toxin-antitoxin module
MTAYERGDIVLVPFPFSDQTTTKKRPAVVVTSNNYNEREQVPQNAFQMSNGLRFANRHFAF